ncbi:ABC transporter permease [Thalassoroseus pseudoceratinae]|uniref:ABC transporter permease n=1 Tax=Thalassoroseus pseudoceratinae TaxID=2713176 RepID=UPI001421046A|nr:ABC transporter permease [Thalassoroseus pseudoceratinae]
MSSHDAKTGFLRSVWNRGRNEFGLLFAILVVIAFTTFASPSYRDKPAQNAHEILRQTSLLGIFALGAATVIISGGIDLSSGSVIAFSATICTSIIYLLVPQIDGQPQTSEIPVWIFLVAFAGTLLVAVLIGSFHAWLITSIGLPPFVATLASLVGLRSLARLLIMDVTKFAENRDTGSTQIYIPDDTFRHLGSEWWISMVVFAVLALALWLLLSRTVIGRHLYAMGGNEAAAELCGIRTVKLKWLAYCIGSVTAAIAGILHASYIGMAEPVNDAVGYELNAIAAAVVGGCSLAGGFGTVGGVILGALFLRVVIDAVAKVFAQNPDILEGLIVGILVVLAVAFNELRNHGQRSRQFFAGSLGLLNVFILTLLAGVITSVTSPENKLRNAVIAAVGTLIILGAKGVAERRALRET